MCLKNQVRLKQKQVTAYKIVEKVGEGQYRPIFRKSRNNDHRTYSARKTYGVIKRHYGTSPFHAFTSLEKARQLKNIFSQDGHGWDTWVKQDLVVVKVILKEDLKVGECLGGRQGVSGMKQFIIGEM